jgi:hypothetical protein
VRSALALGALILVGLLVSSVVGGLRDEVIVLGLLLPAAIGAQIGWSTRVSVPTWVFIALAVGGIALVGGIAAGATMRRARD